jgi:hypothetical protein
MRVRVALLAALGGLWALGCANYDGLAKGEDVAAATERQVQNPERSEERTPVEGIGATTAADVTTNYHANQTTTAQERRQDKQRDNGLVDVD